MSAHHAHDETSNLEGEPWWRLENIVLTSVGIDVGSATSNIVFSEITSRRLGDALSSRFVATGYRTLYAPAPILTPYTVDDSIDADALHDWAVAAYDAARLRPGDIDTGAVILTGEAIRRHNARAIADRLSSFAGDFVCVTAGHQIEALLAAYGSGSVARSQRSGETVLNVDVGGGTTKYALVKDGQIVQTAALHVGGRLAAFDPDGGLVRLEPAAVRWAAEAGVDWRPGGRSTSTEREAVAERMAHCVVAAADGASVPDWAWLTEPLRAGHVDALVMSGGVSEYVYGDGADHGDLGAALGAALRRRFGDRIAATGEDWAGLTATVRGVAHRSVEITGSTIFISDPAGLPVRNILVARPSVVLADDIEPDAVAAAILRHLRGADPDELARGVALALPWAGEPRYHRLRRLAAGVSAALGALPVSPRLLCFVFDSDVGRNFGALFAEEFDHPATVLSLDGLELRDFDFIDIGRQVAEADVVPVAIKSLLFRM